MTSLAEKVIKKRLAREKDIDEKVSKWVFEDNVFGWKYTDLDDFGNWLMLAALRLIQALFLTSNMVHPDEYWQATMPAYNWVYGGVQLPWEWDDQYKLRNTVYVAYLAGPLYFLKLVGLDFPYLVRIQPYLTHWPLVLMNDFIIWQIGKRVVGKDGARFAMILVVFSRIQNEYIIRCFTNSVEQIFAVVAFYFFIDQGNSFTFSTMVLTALISLSFMIRNTSPVGWLPLLALKVLKEGSLLPFITSAIFVAVPVIAACVASDTYYYGGSEIVLTGKNFLEFNVIHGGSKHFGTDPWWFYIVVWMPAIFTVMYPMVLVSTWSHAKLQWSKNVSPYMTYYVLFTVFLFSLLAHKEARFLLPIVPFAFLMTGEYFANNFKSRTRFFSNILKLFMVVEMLVYGFVTLCHQRAWEVNANLISRDEPVHSFYSLDRFNVPFYSWMHSQDPEHQTQIYLAQRNPTFARESSGFSLPMSHPSEYTLCIEMVHDIVSEKIRPQYIVMSEFGSSDYNMCKFALKSLTGEDGGQLYQIDKVFYGDVGFATGDDGSFEGLRWTERILYRLDNKYEPK